MPTIASGAYCSPEARGARGASEGAMLYQVIINDQGYLMIWPDDQDVPTGWQITGKNGTKEECLAYIDGTALQARTPDASEENEKPENVFVAPRTPTEKKLATICADILHLEQVGVRD